MRSKHSTVLACGALILAMLACNVPGAQSNQPDLAATITALAAQVQSGAATPVPATSLPGDTPAPTNSPLPTNTSRPADGYAGPGHTRQARRFQGGRFRHGDYVQLDGQRHQ